MATITDLTICNSALIKIGQERISSLDQTNKTATLCKERLPFVKEEVLEDHPWNCAMQRAELSQLSEGPEYGYTYAYQKPVNCLRIWKAEDDEIIFKVEGDQILTDEPTFFCTYIRNDIEVAKYSRSLAEAIAIRLAAELAYAIANSRELQEQMMKLYEIRLRMAKSIDAQEGYPDELITTTWDKARY